MFEDGTVEELQHFKEIIEHWNFEQKNSNEFANLCTKFNQTSAAAKVMNYAVSTGQLFLCRFLVKNVGIKIDILNFMGDTPLITASKKGHIKVVEYLIKEGALVESASYNGLTALHYAVLNDNVLLMRSLIMRGAPKEADSVEGTPLHCAASRASAEAVGLLLVSRAEPNSVNLGLGSPLICAVKAHSYECIKLLLLNGANPNALWKGLTALALAAKEGEIKYIKRLLKSGADPDLHGTGGRKPIEEAAFAYT